MDRNKVSREDLITILQDESIYQINRCKAHSNHKFTGANCFNKSLNGKWKFHYATSIYQTYDYFYEENFDCSSWSEITVPGSIQLQGYDKPQYVNVMYPWDGRQQVELGKAPMEFNPTGSYVTYVYLSREEAFCNPCYLLFDGVESAFALWVNGQFVGYSEDSFTPSEFMLSGYLKEGHNKIAVQVYKWCKGSWLEDQDFWRLSGIFRDVTLYSTPSIHLRDLKLMQEFTDGLEQVKIVVDTQFLGIGNMELDIALKCKDEVAIQKKVKYTLEEGNSEVSFILTVNQPRLWSAEKPNLYDLFIKVYSSGSFMEEIHQLVGLRQLELKDGLLLLNGKRIVFHGVNRHEFHHQKGRTLSTSDMLYDVKTMKQNNMNAVRTCHYPNHPYFYELCDRYGLYVIDETNLESHGTWQLWNHNRVPGDERILPGDKDSWLPLLLDRANSMYQRDKNHASILFWSCGNESNGGRVIFQLSEFFRQEDPKRLVHYEGIFHDRRYEKTSDVESQMYTSVENIKNYLKEHKEKPLILCEYSHSMGNSTGGLYKYTDLTRSEPRYQGGFIWDFIDQGIETKAATGDTYLAYGGDFLERPSDYNFCGNGLLFADRSLSPKMYEVKYCYQIIRITIEKEQIKIVNDALFTNTNEYTCSLQLLENGKSIQEVAIVVDCKPGQTLYLDHPFHVLEEEGEYILTVSFQLASDTLWGTKGHEVAFGQGVLLNNKKKPLKTNCDALRIVDGSSHLGIYTKEMGVLFSRVRGTLVSFIYKEKEMILKDPQLNFWRAPIDNDYGNKMPVESAMYKTAGLYALGRYVGYEVLKDGVEVHYTYEFPYGFFGKANVSYKVHTDGRIEIFASYEGKKGMPDIPEFGMLFTLPKEFYKLSWYGRGPVENYQDRKKGCKLGVYHSLVEKEYVPYLLPQECGNKTDVRYIQVYNDIGVGLEVSGEDLNVSVLPFTPHQIEHATHSYELPSIYQSVVKVSLDQMGVGGDDSWGATVHPEFKLNGNKMYKFHITLEGITL